MMEFRHMIEDTSFIYIYTCNCFIYIEIHLFIYDTCVYFFIHI